MDDSFQISPYEPEQRRDEFVPVGAAVSSSTPARIAPPQTQPQPSSRGMSRLLIALLVSLVALVVGPFILEQYVYHLRFGELKAGYDVATDGLSSLKPRLNDLELASRLVAKRVEPSVVSIYRTGSLGRLGGLGREGQGSGVIVDPDGYIVTNYHVVAEAPSVQVQLSDGRHTSATIVSDDPDTDLAILKINLPNLIAAEWGDSDKLEVGDLVWALGSPFGLDRSLTFGIVSAKSRHGGGRLSGGIFQEYLQTDAAVNPGNSGGPLVNIDGQIVGINAAIVGTSYQGISFAIPSSLAHEKYDLLRKNGRIECAWLGVEPHEVPDSLRDRLGLAEGKGVYISWVEPMSPAGKAGFHIGDVILKWNDHLATEPSLLTRAIASTSIGSTAKAVVARLGAAEDGGNEIELDVKVERRPRFPPDSR